jgi:hypothetical protein
MARLLRDVACARERRKEGPPRWGVQAAFKFDEGWLGLGGALVLCAFKYARAGRIQGAEKNYGWSICKRNSPF